MPVLNLHPLPEADASAAGAGGAPGACYGTGALGAAHRTRSSARVSGRRLSRRDRGPGAGGGGARARSRRVRPV